MKKAYSTYRNSPLSYSNIIMILTVFFLFLPLFVVVYYSFNADKGMTWTGFSLVWYKELFTNSPDLWRALWNSVLIAFTSSVTATALGTIAAIGIKWYYFKGKRYIEAISYLPMILPEVIIGIAMYFSVRLVTLFISDSLFTLLIEVLVGAFVYISLSAVYLLFIYKDKEMTKYDETFRKILSESKTEMQRYMGEYYKTRLKKEQSKEYEPSIELKEIHCIETLEYDYKRRLGNILIHKLHAIKQADFKRDKNKTYFLNDKRLKAKMDVSRRKIKGSSPRILSDAFIPAINP